MARPLRIEYPGALYHVTTRGNKRQNIFCADDDREHFLKILFDTMLTHNWICHAYCLMDNHFHLLIETVDANLSVGMRDLNGVYTQQFNKKYETVGHLFQGRYHTFLIEKELYLLEVARYIVLNPVRAGIVAHPADWKWSSYNGTVGKIAPHACLSTKFILDFFSERVAIARREYCSFVEDGMDVRSPFLDVKHKTILGSPQFISQIWEENSEVEDILEVNKSERMIGRPALEELFDEGMSKEERNDAILLARLRCGYAVSDIARYLKIHRTTVSNIISQNDKTLQQTT